MTNHTDYSLLLKTGEIINPEPSWVQADDGDIKRIEYYFFWAGYGHNIGSFPDLYMAREYFNKKHVSGIYLTPIYGVGTGRYFTIEEIQDIIPYKKSDIIPEHRKEDIKTKTRFDAIKEILFNTGVIL